MGIPNLRDINMCLFASWIQIYHGSKSKLWREIIDNKYNTYSPNVFCCGERNSPSFWKGAMWAAKAAKMGFRWKVGNGKNQVLGRPVV
jgi:hypothetical protein